MAQVELEKAKTGEKRSDWKRLLDTLAETDGEVEPGADGGGSEAGGWCMGCAGILRNGM